MQRRLRQTRWNGPICLFLALVVTTSLYAQRAAEECTGNESWLPIHNTIAGNVFTAAQVENTLYFYAGTGQTDGALYAWDGSTLSVMDPSTVGVSYGLNVLHEYEGDLYAGGWFPSIDGVAGTRGLARWNGAAWESTGATALYATAMEIYNNELYVAGLLLDPSGDTLHGLAKYDGTTWSEVATVTMFEDSVGSINSMTVYDGKLIISGYFSEVEGQEIKNYAQFDGTNWSAIAALDGKRGATQMVEWNGKLYSMNYGVTEWDGGASAVSIAGTDSVPVQRSIVVYNNHLYVSGSLYIETGDSSGHSSVMRSFARYDGTSWMPVSGINGYAKLIDYNGTLLAYGQFSSSCGTALNNLAFLCDDNNCSRITGTVFNDADSDGSQDNGEKGLSGRIVEINPGSFYASTDSSGVYAQYVLPGSYSVALSAHRYWNTTSATPLSVVVASAGSVSSGNDFGSVPIGGIYDLRVSLGGIGRLRPGFPTSYTLYYANIGTEATSATLSFDYDNSSLSFDSAQVTPDRTSSGRLEWDLASMAPGESGSITVHLTVGSTTPLGTRICAFTDLGMGESHSDSVDRDNHDSSCTDVRGSYDPNDISVTPSGDNEGTLLVGDTVLAYQVRFQNTGTDTAFRVVIRDTLDASLDIPTIEMGASSHPYTWKLEDNGVLVVTFDNILLPDSNENKLGSQGFVKYTIHLDRGLAPQTTVPNRASIYFDFNEGVLTNRVVSITPSVSGVGTVSMENGVRSYPRPAREELYVDGVLVPGSELRLRGLDGRVVLRSTARGGGHERLSVGSLSSGVYVLELETPNGPAAQRILVAR